MSDVNTIVLTGRPTKDAEVRYTQEQKPVAKFNLAVGRRGEGTDFISVTAFSKTAEFCEKYIRKGERIAVTGRIQTGSYTNKDGVKVYTTDVIADSITLLQPKGAAGTGEEGGFMSIPDGVDEDLPFV